MNTSSKPVRRKKSLTCEERDCPLAMTTTGGKTKTVILLVFSAPKDQQKCKLSFGDHDSLDFVAEMEISESVGLLWQWPRLAN